MEFEFRLVDENQPGFPKFTETSDDYIITFKPKGGGTKSDIVLFLNKREYSEEVANAIYLNLGGRYMEGMYNPWRDKVDIRYLRAEDLINPSNHPDKMAEDIQAYINKRGIRLVMLSNEDEEDRPIIAPLF